MASEQLAEIIEMLKARVGARQEREPPLEERRAGFEELGKKFEDLSSVATSPTNADGVPAEWLAASNSDADRVILYLHGGGYVIGSIVSHRGLAANLARVANSRVLNIDYRLAPEHVFPAAVEDAATAYRWILKQGVDPSRVVVAGDSAGGGLTAATLIALRDAGDPMPAAAVCISPWVDLEGTGESMTTKAHVDPMVGREGLVNMAGTYLGNASPKTSLASPIHAQLRGLPPLLIQVGTAETLLDDSTRLAERAKEAGVEVTMESWEDMIHVWHLFAPFLPEGQQAVERIGEFVRDKTGAGVTSS